MITTVLKEKLLMQWQYSIRSPVTLMLLFLPLGTTTPSHFGMLKKLKVFAGMFEWFVQACIKCGLVHRSDET